MYRVLIDGSPCLLEGSDLLSSEDVRDLDISPFVEQQVLDAMESLDRVGNRAIEWTLRGTAYRVDRGIE
jgi:hypothetical protein